VVIGLYPGSKSIPIAQEKGFEVHSVYSAVQMADVIFVSLPDTKQAEVYHTEIRRGLDPTKTLLFAHGFSIHFGTIIPPQGMNVVMVAPKGPGHLVRSEYVAGRGVPSLIAVHQGGKEARDIALAWADGIGATRAGVLETTFKEE